MPRNVLVYKGALKAFNNRINKGIRLKVPFDEFSI